MQAESSCDLCMPLGAAWFCNHLKSMSALSVWECRSAKQLGLDAPLVLDHTEDQLDRAVLAALPPAMQREIRLAYMASSQSASQRTVAPGIMSQLQHQNQRHVGRSHQQTANSQPPVPQPNNDADAAASRADPQLASGGEAMYLQPGAIAMYPDTQHHKVQGVPRDEWSWQNPGKQLALTVPSSSKKSRKDAKLQADQGIGRYFKQPKDRGEASTWCP